MRIGEATDQLDVVGNSEACELLAIDKATLARWMKPGTGDHGPSRTYMIEWKSVAAGPVWDRRDILDFAATNPRKRARSLTAPRRQRRARRFASRGSTPPPLDALDGGASGAK